MSMRTVSVCHQASVWLASMPSSQAARGSRTDRMNFTRPSHADIHRAELDVGWVCLTDRVETRAGQATRTQPSHGPPHPSNAFEAKVLEPPEPGALGPGACLELVGTEGWSEAVFR